jgi:hypothetical protein
MKITLAETGVLRVGGMMLEKANIADGTYQKVGSPYIKTTSAAQTSGHNQIVYRASDAFNEQQGTAIAWAFLSHAMDTEAIAANGPTIIGAPGQQSNFYWHYGNTTANILGYGGDGSAASGPQAIPKNQWTHLAISWDAVNNVFRVYQDGVLLDTGTDAPTHVLTARKITVGGDYVYAEMDYWQGAIKALDIYANVMSDAAVLADYNATKASYGR